MLLGPSLRSRSRLLSLLCLPFLLLAVAFPGVASAATPGSQAWAYHPSMALRVTGLTPDLTGALRVVTECPQVCLDAPGWYVARSSVDPVPLAPNRGAGYTFPPGSNPALVTSGEPSSRSGMGQTWDSVDLGPSGRYVYVGQIYQGTDYLAAVWDLGPSPWSGGESPAPATTAPATTTAPPSSGGTTTPPATSTSVPPSTDPAGEPGSTLTCVEATPCYVRVVDGVTVDVGSLEVSALTEEQWALIELALGVLVFFSAASFVASWRHGRGA